MTGEEIVQQLLFGLAGTFRTEHDVQMWIVGLSAVVAACLMLPMFMQALVEEDE